MKPLFPLKNWAINNLIEFKEGKSIYEFTSYFSRKETDDLYGWEKENLEFQLNHISDLFKNLKEETNQIMHTSNQLTITTFFEELKDNISENNLSEVNKDEILETVKQWNTIKYKEFLKEVNKKETEYFEKPERTKYSHLEKYSETAYSFLTMQLETYTKENKNFYCVETKPELIDSKYLDKYFNILERLTIEFNDSISKELKLYEQGKLLSNSKKESLYDNVLNKLKNNKMVVGILIGILIYGGISSIIKNTKENYDNLYGKDGMIKKENNNSANKHLTKPTPIINKKTKSDTVKQKDSLKNNK